MAKKLKSPKMAKTSDVFVYRGVEILRPEGKPSAKAKAILKALKAKTEERRGSAKAA